MKIFLIVAAVAVLMIGVIDFLCARSSWKSFNQKTSKANSIIRITYKQFYEFYGVSPEKWETYEERLYKIIPQNRCIRNSWYYDSTHYCQITFSFRDYIKYRKFFEHREEMKAKAKEAEDMARFINSVQDDINNLNEKVKNMVKEEEKKEPEKVIVRWVDTNGNAQRAETYKW